MPAIVNLLKAIKIVARVTSLGKLMPNKPRDLHHFTKGDQKPRDDRDDVVRIDVERMKASLESGILKVPTGLSREEKLKFILAHSK